jgi:hypothetical protein
VLVASLFELPPVSLDTHLSEGRPE